MKKIQMVDLGQQYLNIKHEVDVAIQEVLDSTAFINGKAVQDFAQELASYCGVRHVIPCANGTDALQIAMMALDLKAGDEVILPVHTYVATVEVIALLQLKPVFVDVYPDSFNINVEQVEKAISPKTKAIVPVHLYGQCADMQSLTAIAKTNNIAIVEDTAQALGAICQLSDQQQKQAGTIGSIGCTSFFPSKNLGCFGDGGAILSNNDELARKCQIIASHGQRKKYYHEMVGVNSRLDTLQAAILRVKLRYLSQYTAARQKVAKYYDESLANIDGLKIPIRSSFSTHVFHQYTVKIDDKLNRDSLKAFLQEKGIPSMIYYPMPLHWQEAYKHYGERQAGFPVAEQLSKEVLSLPIHTEMSQENLKYIAETIKTFINQNG